MNEDISLGKIAVSIIVAAITAFIMWLYTKITSEEIQLNDFSIILPGDEKIHRAPESPSELVTSIKNHPEIKTIHDNYDFATKNYPNNKCYGWREIIDGKAGSYKWMTYQEAHTASQELSSGMVAFDMLPVLDGMKMLGIFSKNRPEWVIAERACFMQAGTTVPLYDTLSLDTISYILNQTKIRTVVCSASETSKLLSVAASCPALTHIIQMEPPSVDDIKEAENKKIKLQSFDAVKEKGRISKTSTVKPKADDIATFCYTSGTTGPPKGVLLSHSNLISSLAGLNARGVTTTVTERHLSFLPLAHVLERVAQTALIHSGAAIGFYQGNPLKIPEDLAELRPTVFVCVPRLLNRVYAKIKEGASVSPLKKFLFFTALKQKEKIFKKTGRLTHSVWDKLVFQKIAIKLGLDQCRLIVSGSAPLSGEVLDFFRVVLSATVLEGFGQSESAALSTLMNKNDVTSGHIGGPSPNVEIKLVDVPEMGYRSSDTHHELNAGSIIPCKGRGEICIRGPSVFKCYYKMPEKTAETLDKNGWLHTGDVGIWLESGQLKIVDRIKNIFKLSQGEYVAAEKVENVYQSCPYVAQSFIYGDSLKSCLVAVIVPDFDVLRLWAKEQGKPEDEKSLVRDKDAVAMVLKAMTATGREARLHGFELAKAIHLSPEPFSVENDLLTPSFKLKRHVALKTFRKEIDELYAQLGEKS